MSGRKTTLGDFDGGTGPESYDQQPTIILDRSYTTTIYAPGKGGKVAGYTGVDRARGRMYLSPRIRSQHYFRMFEGYAISDKVLHRIKQERVEYVAVWEIDNGRTFVWPLSEFKHGQDVPPKFTEGDEQTVVRCADAIGEWDTPGEPVEDRR